MVIPTTYGLLILHHGKLVNSKSMDRFDGNVQISVSGPVSEFRRRGNVFRDDWWYPEVQIFLKNTGHFQWEPVDV